MRRGLLTVLDSMIAFINSHIYYYTSLFVSFFESVLIINHKVPICLYGDKVVGIWNNWTDRIGLPHGHPISTVSGRVNLSEKVTILLQDGCALIDAVKSILNRLVGIITSRLAFGNASRSGPVQF